LQVLNQGSELKIFPAEFSPQNRQSLDLEQANNRHGMAEKGVGRENLEEQSGPGGLAARENLSETKGNRGQNFVIFQAGSRSGCQIINRKMDRFADLAADCSRSPEASLHRT
jgi:hypothetical protein